MKIGEAAREAGVTIKAIRYYEAIGLLETLERVGRYRELSANDLARLQLIAHCRELGFTLPEIQQVVRLVADAEPACPDPDAMIRVVDRRLGAIDDQIASLQQLSERLETTKAYLQSRLTSQEC